MAPIRRSQEGFTLLELLVALTIFALVATASYAALRQGLRTQERLQQQRTFWSRLKSTFALLESDLLYARARRPRRPGQLPSPALRVVRDPDLATKGALLRFTRGGHASFREGPVSPYRRIVYRLREGRLVRATWSRLDRMTTSEPRTTLLLDGVEEARVRVFDSSRSRWRRQWPPQIGGNEPARLLPAAAEVTLELEGHGRFRRILRIGPPPT